MNSIQKMLPLNMMVYHVTVIVNEQKETQLLTSISQCPRVRLVCVYVLYDNLTYYCLLNNAASFVAFTERPLTLHMLTDV